MKNIAWKSGIVSGILSALVYFALMKEYGEAFDLAFVEIEAFGMGVLVFSLWVVTGKYIQGSWATSWLVPVALGIYTGITYYALYGEVDDAADILQESLNIGIVLFIVGVAIMMIMDILFPPAPRVRHEKISHAEGRRKIIDVLIKQPFIWISGHFIELIVLAIVNVFLHWALDDAGPDFIFFKNIAVFFAGILVFVIWPRHLKQLLKKE